MLVFNTIFKAFNICFFLCCLLRFVVGQVSNGTPCYTSKQEYGLCTNIKECKVFVDLLVSQGSDPLVREYLKNSTCDYVGVTPVVCCPQVSTKLLHILTKETEPGESRFNNITSVENGVQKYTLLSPPNCGFSNISTPRLVGAIPVTLLNSETPLPGEFPWIVALGYRNKENSKNPKWFCGGTLITNRHILTAAHCVYDRNDLYLARVGELDLYSDTEGASPEDIPVIKAKIHEDYSTFQYTNDIAILTLERQPKNDTVWPICLPHEGSSRTNKFLRYRPLVAGWGSKHFNGPSSSVLQVTSIPVVDNSNCKKTYGRFVVDDKILCAGYASGGTDSCKGDSGGPLMFGTTESYNTRFYQIGIVSYDVRCAEAGYPGVYTRVNNYIDWIKRNLN